MEEEFRKLSEATEYVRSKVAMIPECGIVLGSGLGRVVDEISIAAVIEYKDIPHFPLSTIPGHAGKLCFGSWHGRNIVVMVGRFHYYEGYSLRQVTFPVRVMKQLGAKALFITNASGGLNPAIKIGELMVLTDHINLNSDNPLRGINLDEFGPRFPDQHAVYDQSLVERALAIANKNGIVCHKGVYVGVTGPNFETPSEYRYMRLIGGDAVGMSTVPEVIVANHMGMRIFCISVICDEGNPVNPVSVSHEEVMNAASNAGPKVAMVLKGLVAEL